jgi:hypothetical protein
MLVAGCWLLVAGDVPDLAPIPISRNQEPGTNEGSDSDIQLSEEKHSISMRSAA